MSKKIQWVFSVTFSVYLSLSLNRRRNNSIFFALRAIYADKYCNAWIATCSLYIKKICFVYDNLIPFFLACFLFLAIFFPTKTMLHNHFCGIYDKGMKNSDSVDYSRAQICSSEFLNMYNSMQLNVCRCFVNG